MRMDRSIWFAVQQPQRFLGRAMLHSSRLQGVVDQTHTSCRDSESQARARRAALCMSALNSKVCQAGGVCHQQR